MGLPVPCSVHFCCPLRAFGFSPSCEVYFDYRPSALGPVSYGGRFPESEVPSLPGGVREVYILPEIPPPLRVLAAICTFPAALRVARELGQDFFFSILPF